MIITLPIMWHVTWALEAMCSQYSFKLFKWLMSFVTYRCFVSCIVFFVCFFTKIQCSICVNTDQFSSITEWHITYRYMTVRNSCQQLCSEVSDSDSKMSSLFLGTSCECLHPWNYTSLFTSTTGDRRYAEWHPSIPNCLWNPHTQPIPTTFRFPPPFHLHWAIPHTPAPTRTHITFSGTPGNHAELTLAWWIWAGSDGIAAMSLLCSMSSGPFTRHKDISHIMHLIDSCISITFKCIVKIDINT